MNDTRPAADAATLSTQLARALGSIKLLEDRLAKQTESAHDAAHVINHNGIRGPELIACGCEQCRRVFEAMDDAGFIVEAWPDGEPSNG